MQAVEASDQIEVLAGVVLGEPHLEFRVGADAMLGGVRGGVADRVGVEVVADELRLRERLGHQDGRPAVSAADVGHARAGFELRHHPVERGQPLRDEIVVVARPEKAGDRAEHAAGLVAPGDAEPALNAVWTLGWLSSSAAMRSNPPIM